MIETVTSRDRSSERSVRIPALLPAVLVGAVLLALSFVMLPLSSTRPGALAERLVERITREESVSIRIDAERRMVVDSATSLPHERAARQGDWLVLDRRWLSGEGEERDVVAGGPLRRDSLSYVGAVMSDDSHVAITPPFVVLTRGRETVLLRLDAERLADGDGTTPDWIRTDVERGLVVARFDGFSDIEIGADTVRLQRRFLDW